MQTFWNTAPIIDRYSSPSPQTMDGWGVWRVRCEKKLARVIGCCASNLRAVIGCRGQNLHMKEADYRGGSGSSSHRLFTYVTHLQWRKERKKNQLSPFQTQKGIISGNKRGGGKRGLLMKTYRSKRERERERENSVSIYEFDGSSRLRKNKVVWKVVFFFFFAHKTCWRFRGVSYNSVGSRQYLQPAVCESRIKRGNFIDNVSYMGN